MGKCSRVSGRRDGYGGGGQDATHGGHVPDAGTGDVVAAIVLDPAGVFDGVNDGLEAIVEVAVTSPPLAPLDHHRDFHGICKVRQANAAKRDRHGQPGFVLT